MQLPDKYADPNHKPEIAIALEDNFLACYGFCSAETIKKNLEENPVLGEIFGLTGEPDAEYLKSTVHKMFYELDTEEKIGDLTSYIEAMHAHIKGLDQGALSEH